MTPGTRIIVVVVVVVVCVADTRPPPRFLRFFCFFADAQVWDNVGESFFALQTTVRGAQVMLKYRCIVEDGRLAQPPCGEGAMPPLLEAFSKTAAGIPAMM